MKIALYGYGKMGIAIEKVAEARGHQIILRVNHANAGTPPIGADMAIEFSRPAVAMDNMRLCLAHNIPVVVGTTGWIERIVDVQSLVKENDGSLLWSSNFSIGVHLYFMLNKYLAELMESRPGYTARIVETHHVHKLDAPSGTAITLARDIALRSTRYDGWEKEVKEVTVQDSNNPRIPIHSERIGDVPGTHVVSWTGAEDQISISHEAFGRRGFATGAVVAAEWLLGRTGLFTMDDMLDASR